MYMLTSPLTSSPIAEIMDMIFRRAPLLMRAGGGSISHEETNYGKPLPADIKARFSSLVREGKSLRQISTLTGWPYSTIVKHTRTMRGKA